MTVFSDIGGQAAPRVESLGPRDFASDWHNRPVVDVPVGIRLPSEDDVQLARIQADRRIAELAFSDTEARLEAWNDALMSSAVARCICNPRNVLEDCPALQLAEDTITQALTPAAIRRLFDAVERLMVEQSPLVREATNDELVELAERIIDGEALMLTGAPGHTLRRFASYCLELLPDQE